MESDVLLTYRTTLSQVLAVSNNVGVKRPTLYMESGVLLIYIGLITDERPIPDRSGLY